MTAPPRYDVTEDPIDIRMIDFSDAELTRQLDLEDQMREEGREAYTRQADRERARGNGSSTRGARAVISRMSDVLAEKIAEEIDRLESGRVRRKPPMLATLRQVPPPDLAIITLRAVIDTLSSSNAEQQTTARLSARIGREVEAEVASRIFRSQHRIPFETLMKRLNARGASHEQRGRAILDMIGKMDTGAEEWRLDNIERTRLGALLLYLAEGVGIVRSVTRFAKKNTTKVFHMTDEFEDALLRSDALAAELKPSALPTVIPPRPWCESREGGYWTPMRGNFMVSSRHIGNVVSNVKDHDAPEVFNNVNYLQQVPFRVNRKVLEVLLVASERDISFEALPSFTPEALPPKPFDIDTNEDARKVWRAAAREVHNRNSGARGRILAAQRTLATARMFSKEDRIWFPKFLDFRGRVYDRPNTLKPQGNDLSKGLIEFGTAKPLGPSGGRWLAIHGANVFGFDKAPLDERVKWAHDHTTAILDVARDPLRERWWLNADNPAQFLAFCYEWRGYMSMGESWPSRTAVALDGSCNGLQHLSACLRDLIGGSAVNLVPADRPQDIYSRVCDVVVERLKNRASMGEPTAQAWLPLMNRSVVKRPVMTLPYGATKRGFADQIIEDTLTPLERAGRSPFPGRQHAAVYLAELVWEATGEVVVAARRAMDWLQGVARISARAGVPLSWTTPSGWTVRQNYVNVRRRLVKLYVSGQQYVMMLGDDSKLDRIDTRKMAMSVAPNWVHSMDAAHMIRTVSTATRLGGAGVHLAMVHDSFATHAQDADLLASSIRTSFVDIYEEDHWLERFREEIGQQLPEKERDSLPEVPDMGDLDIRGVLRSPYFFS